MTVRSCKVYVSVLGRLLTWNAGIHLEKSEQGDQTLNGARLNQR
jgi:hypothetical protein